MKKSRIICLSVFLVVISNGALSAGFKEGIPTEIMKSDFSTLDLTYIALTNPVPAGSCGSGAGLVLETSNDSSKLGVTFALTALASSKTFRCYVSDGDCSPITGSATTYPVCSYYPSIKN